MKCGPHPKLPQAPKLNPGPVAHWRGCWVRQRLSGSRTSWDPGDFQRSRILPVQPMALYHICSKMAPDLLTKLRDKKRHLALDYPIDHMNLQLVSWMLQAHWSKSEVRLPSHLPFFRLHDITSEASTSRFWEHFQNLDPLLHHCFCFSGRVC